MEISPEKQRYYVQRLLLSRTRLLVKNGFFGLLLMNVRFALDEEIKTAATDGEKIYFSPDFLESLDEKQLDFVLMHEVLHMALSHCIRGKELDRELYNIACDIVVNSTIFATVSELRGLTIEGYAPMHLTPSGQEGTNYTSEEVYTMFLSPAKSTSAGKNGSPSNGPSGGAGQSSSDRENDRKGSRSQRKGAQNAQEQQAGRFDSHDRWQDEDEENAAQREQEDVWKKRIADAVEATLVRDPTNSCGNVPGFAMRIVKELKDPQTDWRTLLQDFLSEEKTDYSFSPPDRRQEGPFFLPDFNDADVTASDILFAIDTSGSMSDDMVTAAYSEVKGAIDQFNGRINGLLSFFDANMTEPKPFCSEADFLQIKPQGGGGTSYYPIFSWAKSYSDAHLLNGIIILTDGYAPFPPEEVAVAPTIWIINNDNRTPEWGKIARIK